MAIIGGVRCRCHFANMEGFVDLGRAGRIIHLAMAFFSSLFLLSLLASLNNYTRYTFSEHNPNPITKSCILVIMRCCCLSWCCF